MRTWLWRGIRLATGAGLLSISATTLAPTDGSTFLQHYTGKPFQDSHSRTVPQRVPGRVDCAASDVGGEGVAYHDSDAVNHGSGELNPADGTYGEPAPLSRNVHVDRVVL